jgi:hypothetical protein
VATAVADVALPLDQPVPFECVDQADQGAAVDPAGVGQLLLLGPA